jgi:CBS domain-containing protein
MIIDEKSRSILRENILPAPRLKKVLKMPYETIEIMERTTRMTLEDILESKSHKIVTVRKDRTVQHAIEIMHGDNVSGIFVVDEKKNLVGLFTERDIVRCVFDKISLDTAIESLVLRELTTFDPSAEVHSAISVALRKKIRHLPVVEGDKIVGMITFRDLVSYLLPEISYLTETS